MASIRRIVGKADNVTVRPAGNISECLRRMISDVAEIEKRLEEAPLSLTGGKEPMLWEIVQRIKKDLEEARKVWLK